MERLLEKVGEVTIRVTKQGDKATVSIGMNAVAEKDFGCLMCACEYLINVVAERSNANYDKAIELLIKGAKQWKDMQSGNA